MGVFTYETEFTSVIPPARLFRSFILDVDDLIPKIAPQAIKGTEILQGDGGPGTIKKVTFGEGSQFGSVTHKIDGIDKDNFVYNYSLIEGHVLSDHKIEKVSYETKLLASADGGTVVKSISNYHTIADVEIKEEHVKAGKEKAYQLFKLVEGYLLANPESYN
ncbi:major strawberry allergen Fra a 1.05 [Rosa sericea]